MTSAAYNAKRQCLQASTGTSVAGPGIVPYFTYWGAGWKAITAVMVGVDTVQLWHKRKLPRRVFDRLIAMGAYYPRENEQPKYGRILRIHHLTQAMLEEIEQIVATANRNASHRYPEMVINRVDIRFDFSFENEAARMMWVRHIRMAMWIPGSRNVKPHLWENGNMELHHRAGRKGGKPYRSVMLYRDPHTTTGIDDPTSRLEFQFYRSRAVGWHLPRLSKIMSLDPEDDILRKHFCLRMCPNHHENVRRGRGYPKPWNEQLPRLPAAVEWEVMP